MHLIFMVVSRWHEILLHLKCSHSVRACRTTHMLPVDFHCTVTAGCSHTHALHKVAVKSHQHARTSCTCVACKTHVLWSMTEWKLQTKGVCVLCLCVYACGSTWGNPASYSCVIDAAPLQIRCDVVRMFNCIRVLIWETKATLPHVKSGFIYS